MKQVAWLNAAPKVETTSKVEVESQTRLQVMQEEDRAPYYPHIVCAHHVINYLFEVGPVGSSGMGAAQITHQEIQSWQSNLGIRLRPWEVRFIRRLSSDYLSMSHEAEKMDCSSPCDASTVDRDYVAEKVKSILKDRDK